MKNNFIYAIIAGTILLTSCYKEDPIVPGETPLIANRFEFPQGDAEWDKFAEDIHEQYGVYLIYKNIDSMDLNRSWSSTTYNNSGYGLTESQAEAHMGFMRDHIFRYLTPEIAKGAFKPFFYLVYNFYGYSASSYGNTFLLTYSKGLDFWVSSILNENNPTIPTDAAKLKEYRVRTLMMILPEAYNKGKLTAPDGFFDQFDFETAIVTSSYDLENPNHYYKRGFPGELKDDAYEFSSYFYGTIATFTPAYTYKLYLFLCMRYSPEELEAMYPSADYPLIHTCRDMVVDHLRNAYGVDLEAIEQGIQE